MSDKDLLNRCHLILDFLYEVRELGHPTSQPKPKEKIMLENIRNVELASFTKYLDMLFRLNYISNYNKLLSEELENTINLYKTIIRNIKIKEITKI